MKLQLNVPSVQYKTVGFIMVVGGLHLLGYILAGGIVCEGDYSQFIAWIFSFHPVLFTVVGLLWIITIGGSMME